MLTIPRPTSQGDSSRLDVEAAAAAVTYIASRIHDATVHTIAKAMYFADKDHLARFGRTIAGETYVAMEYGPVPSAVYDSLKVLAGRGRIEYANPKLTERLRSTVRMDGKRVVAIGEPELDWLSPSDVKSLDRSLELCRGRGFLALSDMAHDAAWEATPENGKMSLESIASTLDNAETVLAHLRGDDDE